MTIGGILFFQSTRITHIIPTVATSNSIITIHGRGFGNERGSGVVSINYNILPPDAYIQWSDRQIRTTLPAEFNSGILRVTTNSGGAAAATITNHDGVPRRRDAAETRVSVQNIYPLVAAIGERVTFTGTFHNYADIAVYFSKRIISADDRVPDGISAGAAESVNRHLFAVHPDDYVERNAHSITVRVPTGATDGEVVLEDIHGSRWSGQIEIDDRFGYQRYRDAHNFAFQIGIGITLQEDEEIVVWMPTPPRNAVQPHYDILFASTDIHYIYRDIGLINLVAQSADDRRDMRITYIVTRHAVDTLFRSPRIPISFVVDNEWLAQWLSEEPHLPINSSEAGEIVAGALVIQDVRGRAARIYNRLLSALSPEAAHPDDAEYTIDVDGEIANILPTLQSMNSGEQISASPLLYSLVAATLMRSAQLPTRVVSGIYYTAPASGDDHGHAYPHYWVECFFPTIGWVPFDVSMGDGLYASDPDRDRQQYYFGNLDSQHARISVGAPMLPRIANFTEDREFERAYFLYSPHAKKRIDPNQSPNDDQSALGYWFPITGIYSTLPWQAGAENL